MSLQPSVGGGSSPRKGKYELIGGSLQAEEHGTVGEGICVGTGSIRQVRERPGHGWGGLQIEYGIGPAYHGELGGHLDIQWNGVNQPDWRRVSPPTHDRPTLLDPRYGCGWGESAFLVLMINTQSVAWSRFRPGVTRGFEPTLSTGMAGPCACPEEGSNHCAVPDAESFVRSTCNVAAMGVYAAINDRSSATAAAT